MANKLIDIECPKCKHSFKYDVIKNLSNFELERNEVGTKEGMGERQFFVGTIYCEKCEAPLELRFTLYPFDDVEDYEIREIEEIEECRGSKRNNQTNYHTDPLF